MIESSVKSTPLKKASKRVLLQAGGIFVALSIILLLNVVRLSIFFQIYRNYMPKFKFVKIMNLPELNKRDSIRVGREFGVIIRRGFPGSSNYDKV
jgi:hypothetical protein